MEFPIDITFKMLGWRAKIHVTDRTGRMIGYIDGSKRKDGALAIYGDESMGTPIYRVRAEHAFTHWFEDAAGRRVGEWGITPTGGMGGGKFIIVEGKPRFRFVDDSGWLVFLFDGWIPNVPVLAGLSGMLFKPRTKAIRVDNDAGALTIVKERKMIDICYSLSALDRLDGNERECLMLSALVYIMQDHYFSSKR